MPGIFQYAIGESSRSFSSESGSDASDSDEEEEWEDPIDFARTCAKTSPVMAEVVRKHEERKILTWVQNVEDNLFGDVVSFEP